MTAYSNESFKVTEFDINIITQSMFENKKSFDYFIIAFNAILRLQKLKDDGMILLQNGKPFDDNCNFFISFESYKGILSMPKLGPKYNQTLIMWVGATMGNKEDTVFVYKHELNDAFKGITYINPEHQHKFEI